MKSDVMKMNAGKMYSAINLFFNTESKQHKYSHND
jgi:hypothetical protein